jgi:hypothetical protein
MNEEYENELQQEINFLYDELAYMQKEIADARTNGDGKEYARLMRLYLPVQKNYLKMCAEQKALETAESNQTDSLLAFAGTA